MILEPDPDEILSGWQEPHTDLLTGRTAGPSDATGYD